MIEFIQLVLNHAFEPLSFFTDIIMLFPRILMMIPLPFLILVALAVVIFIIRLIPL